MGFSLKNWGIIVADFLKKKKKLAIVILTTFIEGESKQLLKNKAWSNCSSQNGNGINKVDYEDRQLDS